jgi:VanZ family protein
MTALTRIRVACILFVVLIVLIVYAADTGIGKPVFDAVRALPLGDKISHFLLMGTLSALTNLAFRCRRVGTSRLAPGIGTLIVIFIVVAEEISQIWIPGRTFELLDLAADFLGIVSGEQLARRLESIV